jgi:hypothetical protein
MSAARNVAVLGVLCGLGIGLTACAQPCMQGCEIVHYRVSTPYRQEACFIGLDGRTRCQRYTSYRTDDRYERRDMRSEAGVSSSVRQ